MPPAEEALLGTLRKLLGHNEFKPFQANTITKIMEGRDVLTIVPTGGGKSACYQVPAMHLPGITLVITPLLALMKDQIMNLKHAEKNFGENRSIAAALSSQFIIDYEAQPHYPEKPNAEDEDDIEFALDEAKEREKDPADSADNATAQKPHRSHRRIKEDLFRDLIKGRYKLFYITPERLRNGEFIRFAKRANISMIAVDEAHCVSLWGYEFRPRYLELPKFLQLIGQRPIITAFTATATQSTVRDIKERLAMADPFLSNDAPHGRENLRFAIERTPVTKKLLGVYEALKDRKGQRGFVYCSTTTAVEEVYKALKQMGISALHYHAKLDEAEKEKNMAAFKKKPSAKAPARVMVATNALGMGIDIQDIRFVIHYQMPLCLENYYQEAGRAGRDGKKSDCILFYSEEDYDTCNELIVLSLKESELWGKDLKSRRRVAENRLKRMRKYALLDGTKVDLQGHILSYFAEFDPCKEQSQPPLQMLDEIEQINVLYVNRTLVAQKLRKGEMAGTDIRVGRYQSKKRQAENRPAQRPLLVSYEVEVKADETAEDEEEKTLTYFDLMVADAVYTLMFHRVPVIYAKNIMGLLSGNMDLQVSPERTKKVQRSIEKMMHTHIKIQRSNPYDFPYEDQRGRPKPGPFLPLQKKGKKGYVYREDVLPPLYEYAEIFHGQFFSIPTRRLRIKHEDQMLFLLAPKKEAEHSAHDGFDGKEIRHIIEFKNNTKFGARSTDTLTITYRTDACVRICQEDPQKPSFTWETPRKKRKKDDGVRAKPTRLTTVKLTENRDDTPWQNKLLRFLHELINSGAIDDLSRIAFRFRSVDQSIRSSLEAFLDQSDILVYPSERMDCAEDMTATEETLKMAHYLYCRVNMMRPPHSPKRGRSETRRKILFDTMIADLNIRRAKEGRRNNVIDKEKVLWGKMVMILEHFQRTNAIENFNADYQNRWVTINEMRPLNTQTTQSKNEITT